MSNEAENTDKAKEQNDSAKKNQLVALVTKDRGAEKKEKTRDFDFATALKLLKTKNSQWALKDDSKLSFNGTELVAKPKDVVK